MIGTYLTEVCFVFYSVATAYIQASIFNYRLANGIRSTINHNVWGWAYTVYAVVIIIAMHSSLIFGLIAAGLIREIFFAPSLNLWRGLDYFYFNPEGKSILDKLIKTRPRYIAIYAVSCVLFIALQILIMTN